LIKKESLKIYKKEKFIFIISVFNRMRNAINYSSVDYDSIEQKLTFKGEEKITENYLIEFAEKNYVVCNSLNSYM